VAAWKIHTPYNIRDTTTPSVTTSSLSALSFTSLRETTPAPETQAPREAKLTWNNLKDALTPVVERRAGWGLYTVTGNSVQVDPWPGMGLHASPQACQKALEKKIGQFDDLLAGGGPAAHGLSRIPSGIKRTIGTGKYASTREEVWVCVALGGDPT
jgi:hypothetical protein